MVPEGLFFAEDCFEVIEQKVNDALGDQQRVARAIELYLRLAVIDFLCKLLDTFLISDLDADLLNDSQYRGAASSLAY